MEILLQPGEMLVFEGERHGRQVRCSEGLLWVTQAGDRRDHLLHSGDGFSSRLTGRIVVTARQPSRLAVTPLHGRPQVPGKNFWQGWNLADRLS